MCIHCCLNDDADDFDLLYPEDDEEDDDLDDEYDD
jgi:hypothetical protein